MKGVFGAIEEEVLKSGNENPEQGSDSADEAGDTSAESTDEVLGDVLKEGEEREQTASNQGSSSFGGSSDYEIQGGWTPLRSAIFGPEGSPKRKLNNAKTDTILKVETLPDSRVKTMAGLLNFALIIGTAAVITLSVLKMEHMNEYVMGEALVYWNIGIALFNLTITGGALSFMSWRIYLSNRAKRIWSKRRKRTTTIFMVELVAQVVNSLFFLAPNVYLLIFPCGWHDAFVHFSGFMRFSSWNMLFLISVITADNMTPDRRAQNDPRGQPDALKMELPLTYHKWKLIPWCIFEIIILWLSLYISDMIPFYRVPSEPGAYPRTCTGGEFMCLIKHDVKMLTIGVGLVTAWYFVYYAVRTYQALEHLKTRSYLQYRMGNIVQRLRARFRIVAYSFIVLSLGILWYYRMDSCTSYALSWLGFLPMQFVMSVLLVIWTFIQHPIKPTKDFVLSAWLQEFSWSEDELEKKKDEMRKLISRTDPAMFCFETAMKLYYWSELVYDYREMDKTEFSLETAMDMYELTNYELFSEPLHDTKVLLAWGKQHILLAFRGTKTLKNVAADLRWFRKAHPPKRNSFWSRPMVHGGFLDSWESNKLDKRIIDKVKKIVSEREEEGTFPKVLVTGHSLGGALASLAALDIARYVGIPKCCIRCYTFGSPRTGNHAFARDYNSHVPDTWHVINDQDYITRTLKFISMYKRHGHRTIINSRGDLIVKPTFLEINALKQWGNVNVVHHLLSSYRRSLKAVVEAQFIDGKKLEGGMTAVLDLLHPSTARHISKVLGVDKPSLLRIGQFGDRISKIDATKRRERQREKWQKAISGAVCRASLAASSVATMLRSLIPAKEEAVCNDQICYKTTMPCGRRVGNDLCAARRRSTSLCLEGGYLCPISHVAHVTFDGLSPNSPIQRAEEDGQHNIDHKIMIHEHGPEATDILGP